MTDEQRKLLLEGIQQVGFALSENHESELRLVTAMEEALIHDKWEHLTCVIETDSDAPYACPNGHGAMAWQMFDIGTGELQECRICEICGYGKPALTNYAD